MFTQDEIEEVKEYLANTPATSKIYLGCDSIKYKKGQTWYARYTTVLVVHIESSKGCKVFGYSTRERDYDPNKAKPRMRLMNEAYKVCEMYHAMAEELEDFEVEIHLDINTNTEHNSSIVIKEACGYVMGMTGLEAKPKPEAFAASYCADHFVRHQGILNYADPDAAEIKAAAKRMRRH